MNEILPNQVWFWIGMSLSLLFLVLISQTVSKPSDSVSNYFFNSQKTTLFPLVATLVMTEFNPATLLAFSGVAYYVGLYALLLPLVFLIGLLFYTFAVAKAWRELGETSVAGLFTKKYGSFLGKSASILLILAMGGFSSAYVKSLILLLKPIFPETSAFLLGGLIVFIFFLWTVKDGLISIIRFDLGSFLICLVMLPFLVYISLQQLDVPLSSFTIPENATEILPPSFIGSLVLLTMLTYIASPWYGQKIFSAIDSKTAHQAVGMSSVLVFLLYSFPIVAVAALRQKNIQLGAGEEGIPYLLNNVLSPFPKGLLFATILAIGGTTLTGLWSTQASMVKADFPEKPGMFSNSVFGLRLIVFFFAIASYIGGITLQESVLSRLILANIPIFALSFALLAGFFWDKVTKIGAYVSIVLGLSWGLFCFFHFGEAGNYTYFWAFYGLPIVFLSGIIGSLLSQKRV